MFLVTLKVVLRPPQVSTHETWAFTDFKLNHFLITHKILQLHLSVYDVLSILAKIIMKNIFLLKIYLFLSFVYESFACICVCTAHVCLVPWGRKRCLHSLELDFKLWAVILWVPRTELRFFVRAARFLNCWPICCFGAGGSTPEPCTSKTVPLPLSCREYIPLSRLWGNRFNSI